MAYFGGGKHDIINSQELIFKNMNSLFDDIEEFQPKEYILDWQRQMITRQLEYEVLSEKIRELGEISPLRNHEILNHLIAMKQFQIDYYVERKMVKNDKFEKSSSLLKLATENPDKEHKEMCQEIYRRRIWVHSTSTRDPKELDKMFKLVKVPDLTTAEIDKFGKDIKKKFIEKSKQKSTENANKHQKQKEKNQDSLVRLTTKILSLKASIKELKKELKQLTNDQRLNMKKSMKT